MFRAPEFVPSHPPFCVKHIADRGSPKELAAKQTCIPNYHVHGIYTPVLSTYVRDSHAVRNHDGWCSFPGLLRKIAHLTGPASEKVPTNVPNANRHESHPNVL